MKERFLKILLFVVIVSIIIVSFYLFIDNRLSNNNVNNTTNTTTTTIINKEVKVNYKEEVFDLKNSTGKLVISNKRNIPSIKYYDNNVSNKIVNYLKDLSDIKWSELNTYSNELVNEGYFEQLVGVSYLYEDELINEQNISFILNTQGSLGGTSWDDFKFYNFSLVNGEILTIDDLTENKEEFEKVIYEYAIDYLSKQDYSEAFNEDWKDVLKSYIFEIGNWTINKNGYYINISKYEIGPGSMGGADLIVPKNIINNNLKKDFKG